MNLLPSSLIKKKNFLLRNTSFSKSAVLNRNCKLRESNLFDLPLIFNLFLDGCQCGSFNSFNLMPNGWLSLLNRLIIQWIFAHRIENGVVYKIRKFILYKCDGKEIGFVQIAAHENIRYIDYCVVAPEERNKGYGKAMIHLLLDEFPPNTEVNASCNKNSKAMQHIFRLLKFSRNKNSYPIERYTFTTK